MSILLSNYWYHMSWNDFAMNDWLTTLSLQGGGGRGEEEGVKWDKNKFRGQIRSSSLFIVFSPYHRSTFTFGSLSSIYATRGT